MRCKDTNFFRHNENKFGGTGKMSYFCSRIHERIGQSDMSLLACGAKVSFLGKRNLRYHASLFLYFIVCGAGTGTINREMQR